MNNVAIGGKVGTGNRGIETAEPLSRFGDEKPMNAHDVLDFFIQHEMQTKDILKVLSLNQNRFTQITKTDADGVDMRFDLTVPQVEVFIRLMNAFPEAQNWKKITAEDVMHKFGFTPKELSEICCNSDSSGDRWNEQHKAGEKIKVAGNNIMLIEAIFRIANPKSKSAILNIARKVKAARYNYDVSLEDNSRLSDLKPEWLLPSTIRTKKIRSQIKAIFKDLSLECDLSANKINQFIVGTTPLDEITFRQIMEDSPSPNAEQLVDKLRLCISWIEAKNQRAVFFSLKTTIEMLSDYFDVDEMFKELRVNPELNIAEQYLNEDYIPKEKKSHLAERVAEILGWLQKESDRLNKENVSLGLDVDVEKLLESAINDQRKLMKVFEDGIFNSDTI